MTNEGTTPPTPPDPNGDQPTPIYKKWWFIALAVILAAVGGGAGAAVGEISGGGVNGKLAKIRSTRT